MASSAARKGFQIGGRAGARRGGEGEESKLLRSRATQSEGEGARASEGAPPVVPKIDAGQLMDPYGLLLKQRIIFLGNQVDDFVADSIVSQLMLLDAQDPSKEIKLFINSPGGSVTAGMGVYDAMQMCRAPISTVCVGLAASMGAFLLAAGTPGRRLSMPNSRIMIHQPLGGASGQAVDIEIQAKELMHHKANLNRLMAFHTNQPVEKVDEDTDRDRYMSPLESKQYGLIDEIIGGDDAGLTIEGGLEDYMKTKEQYIAWAYEDEPDDWSSRFNKRANLPLEENLRVEPGSNGGSDSEEHEGGINDESSSSEPNQQEESSS